MTKQGMQALNRYMQVNNLGANLLVYEYSPADEIVVGQAKTLLSATSRRLTESLGRYQLYDEHGICFVDGGDLDTLKSALRRMLATNHLAPVAYEVPNLMVISQMIQAANRQGVTITGRRRVCRDAWQVPDDQRLMAVLREPLATRSTQLIPIQKNDGSQLMVNLQREEVLVRDQTIPERIELDDVCYDLQGPDGFQVMAVPTGKLGIVLLCALCGMQPRTICQLFLWPDLSQEMLVVADLIYMRCETSLPREMKSLTDLETLADDPIQPGDDLSYCYRFRDGRHNGQTSGVPFAASAIVDVLKRTARGTLTPRFRRQQRLSDWLVTIANQIGWHLYRRQRRQVNVCDIEYFKIENDEIVDLSAVSREPEGVYVKQTVFEIRDESGKLVAQDMPFNELVTTLLTAAVENDANFFDQFK